MIPGREKFVYSRLPVNPRAALRRSGARRTGRRHANLSSNRAAATATSRRARPYYDPGGAIRNPGKKNLRIGRAGAW